MTDDARRKYDELTAQLRDLRAAQESIQSVLKQRTEVAKEIALEAVEDAQPAHNALMRRYRELVEQLALIRDEDKALRNELAEACLGQHVGLPATPGALCQNWRQVAKAIKVV